MMEEGCVATGLRGLNEELHGLPEERGGERGEERKREERKREERKREGARGGARFVGKQSP